MNRIDIADLDCIYLSYDEPKKEETWIKIKNMVPWATRVDGVRGSDSAHKAAAQASNTERFILIDGDNIPDPEFFNQTLALADDDMECVFRWRSRNHINGLMYGNGGLSCWTRSFALDMKTHENTDGRPETQVEFCFDPRYIAMHDCYSTTYPNGSEFQAWRAGFREGVKLCLDRGTRLSLSEFRDRAHRRNIDHLTIWHNIGTDVEHGAWAIAGARHGTWKTMCTDWDHSEVHDFDVLRELWQPGFVNEIIEQFESPLREQLDLPVCVLGPQQSKFFKRHYRSDWQNLGIMVREIDVIRRQEGW